MRVIELDPKDGDAPAGSEAPLRTCWILKARQRASGRGLSSIPSTAFPLKMLECVPTAMDDLKGAAESFGKALRRDGEFRAMGALMRYFV